MPRTTASKKLPSGDEALKQLVKPLLEKKPLRLRCDGIESLPPIVSDGNKVKQILTNLLSNAIKVTQRGGITVSGKNHLERKTVEIAVQDTGIRIRPEALRKRFTAFHQIDADLTREYEGVGLGLKIAKDLSLGLLRTVTKRSRENGTSYLKTSVRILMIFL